MPPPKPSGASAAPRLLSFATANVPALIAVPPVWVLTPLKVKVPGPAFTKTPAPETTPSNTESVVLLTVSAPVPSATLPVPERGPIVSWVPPVSSVPLGADEYRRSVGNVVETGATAEPLGDQVVLGGLPLVGREHTAINQNFTHVPIGHFAGAVPAAQF